MCVNQLIGNELKFKASLHEQRVNMHRPRLSDTHMHILHNSHIPMWCSLLHTNTDLLPLLFIKYKQPISTCDSIQNIHYIFRNYILCFRNYVSGGRQTEKENNMVFAGAPRISQNLDKMRGLVFRSGR